MELTVGIGLHFSAYLNINSGLHLSVGGFRMKGGADAGERFMRGLIAQLSDLGAFLIAPSIPRHGAVLPLFKST